MKKTASAKKTAKKAQKTVKKGVKCGSVRKNYNKSDVIKAFVLVGIIVVLAMLISTGIIIFRPDVKEPALEVETEDEAPEETPAESFVSAAQPLEQKPTERPSSVTSNSANLNTPPAAVKPQAITTPAASTMPAGITPSPPNISRQENPGTLVFVIDDAGNNLRELEPFLKLPAPMTIAVLPGLPNSAETARRIRAAGKEVFLHQPMEAQGGQDTGPAAIYSGMSEVHVREILARNIEEIGPVTGINNHQGSKITTDSEIMRAVLAFCAENNLNFLDSRTTPETVVSVVAGQMGIKIAERNVFLDNEQDKESMHHYLTIALERAHRFGSVVMIGHTWSPQLAVLLAEQMPILKEQGYIIMTASDIIEKRE